jgi:hypothetical protein
VHSRRESQQKIKYLGLAIAFPYKAPHLYKVSVHSRLESQQKIKYLGLAIAFPYKAPP